nr:NADPH-dependent FMN reductase [Mameliella alba]
MHQQGSGAVHRNTGPGGRDRGPGPAGLRSADLQYGSRAGNRSAPAARAFFDKIGSAEGVIVSFAEHNGSYSAAYKNLFDWASRIDQKVYQNKPAVFLSTSPGPGGAGSVLASAKGSAGFFGADLRAAVSVPSFHDVFDAATGHITEKDALKDLTAAAEALALQEVA